MKSRLGRWQAILEQRCPRCLNGKVFTGLLDMHEYCPSCGLKLEREQGYFLGAMYISYALALILIVAFALVLMVLLPDVRYEYVVFLAFVPYLLCVPAVFRYSRLIFMHFDRSTNSSTFDEHYRPVPPEPKP
ncbi:MAG: DUF983 domain-containing protein [Gemmataceae bacterium]|nr:DUF983 domain-containing protein [Gemmataceae bacterium]